MMCQGTLQAQLAADAELKYLAQKAFVSYTRSCFLQPNKQVFDVRGTRANDFHISDICIAFSDLFCSAAAGGVRGLAGTRAHSQNFLHEGTALLRITFVVVMQPQSKKKEKNISRDATMEAKVPQDAQDCY